MSPAGGKGCWKPHGNRKDNMKNTRESSLPNFSSWNPQAVLFSVANKKTEDTFMWLHVSMFFDVTVEALLAIDLN